MDSRDIQLGKIRALLAKAEASTFPEEAKAFFDGAQRLMTTYAIEEAEIRSVSNSGAKPVMVTVIIERPYTLAKVQLLNVVARNANCLVTIPHSSQRKGADNLSAYLYGFPNRVVDVEMMFTSLLIQCTGEMLNVVKPDGVHGKTYWNNFILGFVAEIKDRLSRARREAEQASTVGNALVLVREEVKQVEEFRGKVSKSTTQSRYNASARAAGREAGARASFNRGSVGNSSVRGAIG